MLCFVFPISSETNPTKELTKVTFTQNQLNVEIHGDDRLCELYYLDLVNIQEIIL